MLRKMLNYRIQYNGTFRVRTELYDKMQALSLGWHGSRSQGDAIYRLSYDSLGPWGVIDTLIGSTAASVTLTAMIWIMLRSHVLLTVFALSSSVSWNSSAITSSATGAPVSLRAATTWRVKILTVAAGQINTGAAAATEGEGVRA